MYGLLFVDADDPLGVGENPSTERPPLSLQAFLNRSRTAPRLDIANVNGMNACTSNVKGKEAVALQEKVSKDDETRSKHSETSDEKESQPRSSSTKEEIGEVTTRAGQGSVSPPRVRGKNKGSNYFVSDTFKRKRHSMSPTNNDCPSVVVAEDNKVNQLVVKKTLASIGIYDVRVAANGLEALAFLDERLCDLVRPLCVCALVPIVICHLT